MRPRPESATRPSTSSTVATSTRPKLIRTSTNVFSSGVWRAGASYAGCTGVTQRAGAQSGSTAAPEEPPGIFVIEPQIHARGGLGLVARPERLGVTDGSAQLGEERVVVARRLLAPHRLLDVVDALVDGSACRVAERVVAQHVVRTGVVGAVVEQRGRLLVVLRDQLVEPGATHRLGEPFARGPEVVHVVLRRVH